MFKPIASYSPKCYFYSSQLLYFYKTIYYDSHRNIWNAVASQITDTVVGISALAGYSHSWMLWRISLLLRSPPPLSFPLSLSLSLSYSNLFLNDVRNSIQKLYFTNLAADRYNISCCRQNKICSWSEHKTELWCACSSLEQAKNRPFPKLKVFHFCEQTI